MSGFHTTYRRHDGDAPGQATITWDNRVATPAELKGSRRTKYGTYPETPNFGAYTIMRGDILLAPVKHSNRENRYQQESMGVFSSFAGQNQPNMGEIDDYCQSFVLAGLAKNTLTNADDANYLASQGVPRVNSTKVASFIDGGWGKVYNNHYAIRFGDLLIWEPPTPNYGGLMTGTNSKVLSNKKERMVAKLRPLDWTAYSNYYNKIGVYLLQYSENNALEMSDLLDGNKFGKYRENKMAKLQAALNTKRKSMVDAACTIKVLQDRGYLEIITPHESKKRAALTALYQTVNKMVNNRHIQEALATDEFKLATVKSDYDQNKDVDSALPLFIAEINKAFLSYQDVVDDIKDRSEYEEMREDETVAFSNQKFTRYTMDPDEQIYFESYPRDEEDFGEYKLGNREHNMTFDLSSIAEMKKQKDTSFNWISTVLGLGANSRIQEHKHVTHDIIRMIENRHLGPEDSDIYLMSYETYAHGLKTGDVDELSFIQHTKNSSVGMWVSWEILKKAMESRVVGRATSIASGEPGATSSQDRRVDIVLGPHYI